MAEIEITLRIGYDEDVQEKDNLVQDIVQAINTDTLAESVEVIGVEEQ